MSESVKTWVDTKIKSKKVVMFSKSYSPYCAKAKAVLFEYGIPAEDYEEIEIEGRPDCSEIQDYFRKITGARTVPRVFIKGEFIGGGDELQRLHDQNKLNSKLED